MTLTRRSTVLISLCIGLLAAALTFRYLTQERARAARQTQPVPVVVTTHAIAARTLITPADVQVKMLPVAVLPPDSISSLDEVSGQVAVAALRANAPVPRKAIAARDARLGMAYLVPAGMRAVAVALDPIIGVAGFLNPGDRVDVVTTISVEEQKVTRTVLQDVTLLAIGPTIHPDDQQTMGSNQNPRPQEEPTATLAVTPDQAEKLILAESGGRLRLTLRPADDRKIIPLHGIRSDQLTNGSSGAATPAPRRATDVSHPTASSPHPPTPSAAAQPASLSIETIRGTERTTVEVSPN